MYGFLDVGGIVIVTMLAVMAAEGSSIPFPGFIIILTGASSLNLNFPEMAVMAVGMSIVYCVASFVPYVLGRKMQHKIKKKFLKQTESAQSLFKRYGEFSIALTRPFSVGNYISYVAGISEMDPRKYSVLTFLGIYPWSLAMLYVSHFWNKGSENLFQLLGTSSEEVYIGLAVIAAVFIGVTLFKQSCSVGRN